MSYDLAVTHGSVNTVNLILFCLAVIGWWELAKMAWRDHGR